jgi:hypothetical protein
MIKRRIIILLFFIINILNINAQISYETKDLLIKLTLFKESLGTEEVVNKDLLNNFLNVNLQIDTLENEGFTHFDFYSISPLFDPNGIEYDRLPLVRANCDEYILAISRTDHQVYRLKGFFSNDFPALLRSMEILNYGNISNRKRFVDWYFVDKLDFDCLFKAYMSNSIDANKYPCLHYCSEFVTTH